MTVLVKFKRIGHGFLATTDNDGRAVFCKTREEAEIAQGTFRGELLGIGEGFVIQQVDCPQYGLFVGETAESALADQQRIYDENTGEGDESYICAFVN